MSKSVNMRKRLAVMLIIIGILLVGSVIAIWIIVDRSNEAGCYAEIYQDDKLIRTVDLTNVNEPYQFTIYTDDDNYNTIEVMEGKIGIVDASCPDLLCKNMGYIDNSLMPITCLPNHLIIKVINKTSSNEIDTIVY